MNIKYVGPQWKSIPWLNLVWVELIVIVGSWLHRTQIIDQIEVDHNNEGIMQMNINL